MNNNFWKPPSYGLSLDAVEKLEIFRVADREIISEVNWPASFWNSTSDRIILDGEAAEKIMNLFKSLKIHEPARCHMPPWGMAIYMKLALIYTVTICFECSNCYVYSKGEKKLRAFDTSEIGAIELLKCFQTLLPIN